MTSSELKKIIKEKGLTYPQLSQLSGVPINTIQNFMSNRTAHPRIDTMQALEKALELDKKHSLVQKLEHRPGVQKIIEESEKFTELGLAAILGMIVMLAKEHPEYLIKY